jgi:hypothetical protein
MEREIVELKLKMAFFQKLRAHFVHLDPDPHSECGSNNSIIQIRIRNLGCRNLFIVADESVFLWDRDALFVREYLELAKVPKQNGLSGSVECALLETGGFEISTSVRVSGILCCVHVSRHARALIFQFGKRYYILENSLAERFAHGERVGATLRFRKNCQHNWYRN